MAPGVGQVVQAEEHVAEALALQAEGAGLLRAGADEDAGIAVSDQLVDHQHGADGRIGADGDAHLLHAGLVAVEEALGQAELRDAVLEQAADLALPFKDRHGVTRLRQLDRHGHAGGAAADDGGLLVLFRGALHRHAVEVHVGDILLNAGEVDRGILDAADAAARALLFVVADDRADSGHGVVLEELLPRLHQPPLLEHLDDHGDGRMDRAALLAAGILAVEAAVRLRDDMQRHHVSLRFQVFCFRNYIIQKNPV